MLPLVLLMMLLVAPAARSQTLIDAAGTSGSGGISGPSPSGNFSGGTPAPVASSASADPSADTPFVVNCRLIRLCPSGLPCIGQVRRTMGLR